MELGQWCVGGKLRRNTILLYCILFFCDCVIYDIKVKNLQLLRPFTRIWINICGEHRTCCRCVAIGVDAIIDLVSCWNRQGPWRNRQIICWIRVCERSTSNSPRKNHRPKCIIIVNFEHLESYACRPSVIVRKRDINADICGLGGSPYRVGAVGAWNKSNLIGFHSI